MSFQEEIIRSRQNRSLVELCKLSDRKKREENRLFRFDGIKLLDEALKQGVELTLVVLRAGSATRIQNELALRHGPGALDGVGRVILVEDQIFDKISEEKSPEGVICVAKYIDKFEKIATICNSADFLKLRGERIVLLESVRDPSNIGAIIRSAAAIGVDRMILSADCADIYHPKAVRASMGALFNQRIDRVDSLPEAILHLRRAGRWVFAAALEEDSLPLGSFSIREGDCVVIGNEGHGLSRETVQACDRGVIIPMTDRVESFNAAVAASILMWEFSKSSGS